MIRKALLPVLAASAVMVSTPALAQNFGVTLSFGSPGYSQPYGYGYGRGYAPRDLRYRAQVLSQHIERMAWSGGVDRLKARDLSRQLNAYRRLEYRYARNGLSAGEYRDLERRLDRIQFQVQRASWSRW
ncbi:hypothetical protein [Brevundimonas sp.]|uniref:hypothetical protein n=1 Tax=Brevundimonas sp. TaxID=1871086 RepID=UPI002D4DC846|nr:hypothetical protein [Brevundimonas sp.]HYD28948.1 hypothetical protein [Brevundimonas sp.]